MSEPGQPSQPRAPERGRDAAHPDDEASPTRILLRILGLARPYVGLIVVVALFTLLFSAGRYGRAYLMKPLLDGVLVPAQSEPAPETLHPTGAEGAEQETAWLTDLIARALPDDLLTPPGAPARERDATSAPMRSGESADDGIAERPRVAAARTDRVRSALASLLIAAALIVVVTPLALFGRVYLGAHVLGRVHVDVQRRLADKLLALPLAGRSGHGRRGLGDLLTRLQIDVLAARDTLRLLLEDFLVSICMIAVGLSTLLFISVPLTIVSLAAAPLIAGVLIAFGRRIRRRARRRQARLGELTERLFGMLSGLKVIRAFGGEASEARAFEREAERVFRADMRVVQGRVLSRSTVEALNSAAGFVMLLVGSILVLQGRFGLTTGDVAAFATVLATTYKPVKNLSKGYGRLMELLASGERLFAVLDAEEEPAPPADAIRIECIEKDVRFEGVSLAYVKDHVNGPVDGGADASSVLRDIDLTLERGEVVALVGRSGAGKTSLVDLMLGLYRPTRGRIMIDGTALEALDAASVRARMAVVGQEAFLFDTSIAENIRYGRPEASDAEVRAAAHAAHVDEFAASLPDGLDTAVGAFGVGLSGGQRQRIAIARALLRMPDVLIFDEATSALDPRTERIVREAIESLRGDRLIVIVSHRLASVRDADRIVVLESGRLVESGRHDELMARGGVYRDLADG